MSDALDNQKDNKKKREYPFKKGVSGNPKGRPPKGETLTEILREIGEEEITSEDKKIKITRRKLLGVKMWNVALKGDKTIMMYLYNRLDGMPKQQIDQVNHNIEEVDEMSFEELKSEIEKLLPDFIKNEQKDN